MKTNEIILAHVHKARDHQMKNPLRPLPLLLPLLAALLTTACIHEPSQKKTAAPEMVLVGGGKFQMGSLFSGEGYPQDIVHSVTLSSFYISKYEVTVEEFKVFSSETGYENAYSYLYLGRANRRRPMVGVSWYDAVEYCNWLSQKENRAPVYKIDKQTQDRDNLNAHDTQKWKVTANWTANGYRLPTEAEWEYAARERGRKVRFGNGRDVINPAEINFNRHRQKTVPVDSLSANSLGLKHMSGNVWEWCWDWVDWDYYAQSEGVQDPKGPPSGEFRAIRGGSWNDEPAKCKSACRSVIYGPYARTDDGGFRVVRNL